MNLNGIAEKLQWDEPVTQFFRKYETLLFKEYPETIPEHLTWEFYEKRISSFGDRKDLLHRIRTVCSQLQDIPEACFFGWAIPFLDFEKRIPDKLPAGKRFPTEIFGENTNVFFWMIKAGLIPILAKKYEEMGIPVSHAESYLLTLIGIGDIYAEGHNNIPGAAIGIPSWERKYANLTLFRIGRLAIEFCTHPIYMPAIFRRKSDGAIKVLCRDGWQLDPGGAMPCSTELPGPEVKTVHLTNGKDWISGVPIDPYGKCDPEKTITLDTTEWLPACSPWDIVGDIHIPGNGSLTPERIRDSLQQATEFARKYLNREVAIFACSSWILNPAWERELPNSNIADFQRQCWRVPADCYDVEGLGFVFGRSDGDRLSYPQKTSLHKAFHRIMASGEKLRSGTIFIFPEHLPFYGTSYYRNNYNEQ